jgi:probable phosphoglycerate mutase
MTESLPEVFLVRHGETEWSISGRHTGRTDIPLTPRGEQNAVATGKRLAGRTFAKVLVSPRVRARRTCELAGFGALAEIDDDLQEWDYGAYEGLRTVEIHHDRPDWDLFRDGCPGGESVEAIGARADRVVDRIREVAGDVLVFAHAHILRVLGTRWIQLDAANARHFVLSTATLSILGYEHSLDRPAIRLWNDDRHVVG